MFYVLLLEQNTIRKGRMNTKVENTTKFDLSGNNNGEYKVERIWKSTIYAKEFNGHLLGLYYLIVWKNYPTKTIPKSLYGFSNIFKS